MIEGILFDMDGVLFDTERPCVLMERAIAAEMGFEMTDAQFASLPGHSTEETRASLMAWFGPAFDYAAYKAALIERLAAYEAEHGLVVMPEVAETVAALHAAGVPMAVASSALTASVEGRLAASGLGRYFSAAVGVDMAGGRSKPLPDIFLLAAQKLGLPPQRCAAVEDSYNGIKSAAAAGCVTVMIPDLLPPTDEVRPLCAAILKDMAALPAFIKSFGGDMRPTPPVPEGL